MEQLRDTPAPRDTVAPTQTALRFHLIDRKPPSIVAIVLAIVLAGGGGRLIIRGLRNTAHARQIRDAGGATRGGPTGGAPPKDEKDDPNQIDTIVLGDAADAPVPARKGERGSPSEVHPTILIRLPRYGDAVGLIPDTPTGHLFYQWLAAFNQGSLPALEHVLPNDATFATGAAQMALRVQTGGFFLLAAKEPQPGVIVFRMRDQTPEANEVLGTLHMRADSKPPTIASLSIRSVQPVIKHSEAKNDSTAAPPPQEKR
jgi:hypothetical protein